VQINRKMSFADALRSVLRQDPDVILVGEVRDAETAKLCFQAAETGHLVFTTLHANGALEVIERLSGLGIEKLTLYSNLRLSIAQRLEQRLCVNCAVTVNSVVGGAQQSESSPWTSKQRGEQGCSLCVGGIRGRVPILEWASIDEVDGKKTPKIQQSLQEARMLRVVRGEIDCKEVMK
jgi:type IV pilus assembly protein PilB